MEGEHPTAEKVAAYLDGSLPVEERPAFTAHLARCRDCRREVIAAGDLIAGRRRRQQAAWMANGLAAAAVLAAVVFVGPWRTGPPLDVDRFRSEGSAGDSASAIAGLTPADGDTVSARNVVFAWRAQPGEPLYRLNLTDGTGSEVWTHDTRDTLVSLPPSIALQPGSVYYWYVDALDAGGRSVSTGLRRFTAVP